MAGSTKEKVRNLFGRHSVRHHSMVEVGMAAHLLLSPSGHAKFANNQLHHPMLSHALAE